MIVKLKLELKWSKIKRVVTLPGDLNLVDLHPNSTRLEA